MVTCGLGKDLQFIWGRTTEENASEMGLLVVITKSLCVLGPGMNSCPHTLSLIVSTARAACSAHERGGFIIRGYLTS